MQLERRAEVAAIVSGMNAGVADAYVRWFDIAEAPVRSIVFKAISETGIWVDQDRRRDIVRDAILDLAAVTCRSWSTNGGALPWQWAKSRIRGLAHQGIGFVADDLDRHGDAQVERKQRLHLVRVHNLNAIRAQTCAWPPSPDRSLQTEEHLQLQNSSVL